jgi:hypothetical protein
MQLLHCSFFVEIAGNLDENSDLSLLDSVALGD